MTKETIIKTAMVAAGLFIAYRFVKKRLPLAGLTRQNLLVDVSHPRSCCGNYKNVTYDKWEFDKVSNISNNFIPFTTDSYTTNTMQRAI